MNGLKYKVGDIVRIKSLDWYNKNKDNYGAIYAGNGFCFWKNMARHCGEIMKITIVKVDPEDSNKGYYFMEHSEERWTDEMIEELVEGKTLIERFDDNGIPFNEWLSHRGAFHIPEGYILKDENDNVINATKVVLEKKKKEYPKTYDECCKVLGYNDKETYCVCHTYADERLFESLYRLKVCRDAYWKLAGEEMGLETPWEPNWTKARYIIYRNQDDIIGGYRAAGFVEHHIFEFPTKEMRDAFKENFDPDIKICKMFL